MFAMTTWSEVEGEYIEDRIAIREIGNQLYSGDTRRRSHATRYNLRRNAGTCVEASRINLFPPF
jgi:hypothetical protein